MAYIITEPCVSTCDTACVEVCPVDCIQGPDTTTGAAAEIRNLSGDARTAASAGKQLYINPDECIDCGVCEPECPVNAIFPEDEVPDQWQQYIDINAKFFNS